MRSFLITLFCVLFFATSSVPAGPLNNTVPITELSHAIQKNISRVEEFKIIKEAANELGLRVWLFGGTASGYAHYVKWDMLRIAGDKRYIESRFDYDFTNIYRSTQDADLVVDGKTENVERFEKLIKDKLSYLQGSKQEWEVRLLSTDRGDKQALLNNPDYLNQHTDSNSTGMIEITSVENESAIRDLREWNNQNDPFFLKDVAESKLHYYYNPLHKKTSRYLAHHNPEIFSVIRYFTKAFQYELEIRSEDLTYLKKIIQEFDPKHDPLKWSDWARGWIESRGNGAKLIKHAMNNEYAWNILEEVGLRKKLIAMSDVQKQFSLAWWLGKEPLRSKKVGAGKGKTIKEIVLEKKMNWNDFVVSHETSDFISYESITRDVTGNPNVLISRDGAVGEAAVFGDGHYTRIGKIGARGSGLTIRYKVHPSAREGTDFILAGDDYIVFKNRQALQVIPESLNITPLEYFQMLVNEKSFDVSEKGVVEKLKRKISNQLRTSSKSQESEIVQLLIEKLKQPQSGHTQGLRLGLVEWFSMPNAVDYPDLVEEAFAKDYLAAISNTLLAKPRSAEHPEWMYRALEKFGLKSADELRYFIESAISKPHWNTHFENIVEKYLLPRMKSDIGRNETLQVAFCRYILTNSLAKKHEEWISQLIPIVNDRFEHNLIKFVLSEYPHRKDWAHELLKKTENRAALGPSYYDETHPVESYEYRIDFMSENVFSKPIWKNDEYLLNMLENGLKKEQSDVFVKAFIRNILSQPHWSDRKDLLKKVLDKKIYDEEIIEKILSQECWNEPELVANFIAKKDKIINSRLINYAMKNPAFVSHPEFMRELVEYGLSNDLKYFLVLTLQNPLWINHSEAETWIDKTIKSGKLSDYHDWSEVEKILSNPKWGHRADWIQIFTKTSERHTDAIDKLISMPHWQENAELKKLCGGKIDRNCIEGKSFLRKCGDFFKKWF